jgi:beta-lactamase regulating signal transducer with metallopeptidase domain
VSTISTLWADALLRASIEGGAMALAVYLFALPLRTRAPRAAIWLWRLVFAKFTFSLLSIGIPLFSAVPSLSGGGSVGRESLGALPLIILAASAAGMALEIARFADGRRRVAELMSGTARVSCDHTLRRLEALSRAYAVARPVLLSSRMAEGPLLVGCLRPAIVLPAALLSELSDSDLDLVLSHELAHIRSRDLQWAWLPFLANLVFFFHPLVRLAQRELILLQEIACDRAALEARASERVSYARLLLSLSTGHEDRIAASAGMMGMSESFHLLELRFQAIAERAALKPIYRVAAAVALSTALALTVMSTGSTSSRFELEGLGRRVGSPSSIGSMNDSVRFAAPAAASIAGPTGFSGERPPSPVGLRARQLPQEVRP